MKTPARGCLLVTVISSFFAARCCLCVCQVVVGLATRSVLLVCWDFNGRAYTWGSGAWRMTRKNLKGKFFLRICIGVVLVIPSLISLILSSIKLRVKKKEAFHFDSFVQVLHVLRSKSSFKILLDMEQEVT